MNKNVTGIILAGGEAKRLNGIEKGLIEVQGKRCIERTIEALEPITDEIIISTNSASYDYLNKTIINDIIQNIGPIGGLYSALIESNTDKNIVVGCDMPFITTEALLFILNNSEGYQIALPTFNKRLHPVCGFYDKNCVSGLKNLIDQKQYMLRDAIKQFKRIELPITKELPFYSEELFYNINTPAELLKLSKTRDIAN